MSALKIGCHLGFIDKFMIISIKINYVRIMDKDTVRVGCDDVNTYATVER